jgi:hypothetical protein
MLAPPFGVTYSEKIFLVGFGIKFMVSDRFWPGRSIPLCAKTAYARAFWSDIRALGEATLELGLPDPGGISRDARVRRFAVFQNVGVGPWICPCYRPFR